MTKTKVAPFYLGHRVDTALYNFMYYAALLKGRTPSFRRLVCLSVRLSVCDCESWCNSKIKSLVSGNENVNRFSRIL